MEYKAKSVKTGETHKRTTIRLDIESEIKRGDLVRHRGTGEVFLYEGNSGATNYRWLIHSSRGYFGQYNLWDLQLVDKEGRVLKEWLSE